MRKFYASRGSVFKNPVKKKIGFKVCDCPDDAEAHRNACIIADALNGMKAKRIIRSLIKFFPDGSPEEEKALKEILAAEKFLKEGPVK